MSTRKRFCRETEVGGNVSRREILQAGLAAAATLVSGRRDRLLAQNERESRRTTRSPAP